MCENILIQDEYDLLKTDSEIFFIRTLIRLHYYMYNTVILTRDIAILANKQPDGNEGILVRAK